MGTPATLLGRIPPGLRYMAIGAFWFSLMSLFVRLAGAGLPSMQIVLARIVISLVLSIWMLRRAGLSPWGHNRPLLALRGLLGFIALSCFYYALVHLPLADATVIQYMNPVFAAVLAALLLGERMRRRELLCILLSLVGVLAITRPEFLAPGLGTRLPPAVVGIAVLGSVLSAGAYVAVRKLGRTEDPLVTVFWFPFIALPLCLPIVLPMLILPTPREWLLLLAVGISTHIAQVYMTRGLQLERAGRATAVGYLQIVLAGFWGLLVLGEQPDLFFLLGTVLIVSATLALARGGAPRIPPSPPPPVRP
ncbi:MAG: DMT family transporter [Deltaproteobacteria bacterium]|nr:MAG: DMT family transporter [Deltaproteobacteria bacterium]